MLGVRVPPEVLRRIGRYGLLRCPAKAVYAVKCNEGSNPLSSATKESEAATEEWRLVLKTRSRPALGGVRVLRFPHLINSGVAQLVSASA